MADRPASSPRRRRRWLWILGGAMLVLLVIVALLPTFITWGLGRESIRSAIQRSINGEVQFDALRVGWFGEQSISGFRIIDDAGNVVADLNVNVSAPLWRIAWQRPGALTVHISGRLEGAVREDGSITFADLLRSEPASRGGRQPAPAPPSTPFQLPDLPPLTVRLNGLTVVLTNLQTRQRLELQQLNGWLAYEAPTQPISLSLQGQTSADGVAGSLAITGDANQLFSADGGLSLRNATARFDARVESMPLPVLPGVDAPAHLRHATVNLISDDLTGRIIITIEARGQIEGQPESYLHAQASIANVLDTVGDLTLQGGTAHINVTGQNLPWTAQDISGIVSTLKLSVVSNDLTKTIVMSVDSNAQLADHAASTLTASLSMDEVLAADGTPRFAPEKITGTVQGATIPTSILDPMMAGGTIVPSRDLGPVADLSASFSTGSTREITINLQSPLTQLEARASVDTQTQAIRGSHLAIASLAQPELVRGLTNLQIDRPINASLRLTSFVLPPLDAQTNARPMADFAATGTLNINGPAELLLPGPAAAEGEDAPQPVEVQVQHASIEFSSPALSQHLDINGTAVVEDGGNVGLKHRITNLISSEGRIDLLNSQPVGTLTLTNIPQTLLTSFVPQQQSLIGALVGPALNATVTTESHEQGLSATMQASAAEFTASATTIRSSDALQVLASRIELNLTPELVKIVQQDAAEPIVLQDTARAVLEIQPFTLPRRTGPDAGPFSYAAPSTPIGVAAEIPALVAENVPSFAEPVGLFGLMATVMVNITDTGWTSNTRGDVIVRRPATDRNVATTRYVIDMVSADQQQSIKADVRMVDLSLRGLEQMLGQPRGAISQWTGEGGEMIVVVESTGDSHKALLRPMLPNIKGDFNAAVDAQMVTLSGRTTEFALNRRAIERRLNVSPQKQTATPEEETPAGRMRVPEDVPLTLNIARLQVPRAALSQQAFDPEAAEIDLGVTGGSMRIISPDGAETALKDVNVAITSANLSQGVKFDLRANASAVLPEQPTTGTQSRADAPRNRRSRQQLRDRQQDIPEGAVGVPPELALQDQTGQSQDSSPQDRDRQQRRRNRDDNNDTDASNTDANEANRSQAGESAAQPRVIEAGKLQVSGTILDLLTKDNTLDFSTLAADAKVKLDATASAVPTAVADAFANMQGLLVAALGPVMNAKFTADDFSIDSGELVARIDTTHGWLEATVQGRENALRITRNNPLRAELALSEQLRERLLYRIHPILADVRTVEQPIRANIPWAVAPLNVETGSFDIANLGSNIEIQVGRVQFESGSRTLGLLRFFGQAEGRETIPGNIEPISAKIRNGILTYDQFNMKIDRYTLAYSGQINLVKGTVDLRTEVPLEALAHSIQELEPYADRIVVPLVTRGSFGNIQTQIDPDFDIGKAALDAGFRGGLEQLLQDKGGLQGLFDHLRNRE